MSDKHGDFGYEKGSTWHKIMTEGTTAEKQALDTWLDEARADARAMEGWARGGGVTEVAAEEAVGEILTPDVDAYLQKRNPDGE